MKITNRDVSLPHCDKPSVGLGDEVRLVRADSSKYYLSETRKHGKPSYLANLSDKKMVEYVIAGKVFVAPSQIQNNAFCLTVAVTTRDARIQHLVLGYSPWEGGALSEITEPL